MQAFADFRQQINNILDSNSSIVDKPNIVRQLEQPALNVCLSFDTQIRALNDLLHTETRALNDILRAKNDDIVKAMQERFDFSQELNTTKDSARTLVKCLNLSLKSSCHVVARTIIEMITRGQFESLNLATEELMNRFRREKNYPVRHKAACNCD